jgi:hypothetical protein
MNRYVLLAGIVALAPAAFAQDAEVTILIGGDLLDHGGVVDVRALAAAGASVAPQTITVTDRYARITFRYPPGASYNFRFRPVADALARKGMDDFTTVPLSIGSLSLDGTGGLQEFDTQTIHVLPFAAYGASEPVERVAAAWGETEGYDAKPPAHEWGARALDGLFHDVPEEGPIGLICADVQAVTVCTPDPQDALLMEALWWRSIAEGRLERLRSDALTACYDSRGDDRPASCEGVAGLGWPAYVPAD